MQKRMLVLLFIIGSLNVYAMEKESSSFLSPLRLFLPKRFVSNSIHLSTMQKLQTDRDKFEEWLLKIKWFGAYPNWTAMGPGEHIYDKPVKFLKYCYMPDSYEGACAFHIDYLYNLSLRSTHKLARARFNQAKKARKNGYSALGAAILARGVSGEYKRNFIYWLLQYGFTLTDKDRGLLKLALYQAASPEVLSLLHDTQQGNFAALPLDIRRCVVYNIVHLLKGKEWVSLLIYNC